MPIPASGPVAASSVLTEFAPFQPAPATFNPPSIPANARLRFLTNTYNPASPSIPTTNNGILPFSVYRGKNGKAASVPVQTYTLTSPGTFVSPNTGTASAFLVGGGGGGGIGVYQSVSFSGGGGGSGGAVSTVTTTLTAGASYPYTVGAGGAWGGPANFRNGFAGGSTSIFGVTVQGGNGATGNTGGAARANVNKGGNSPGYSQPSPTTLVRNAVGDGGTGVASPALFGVSLVYAGGGGAGASRGATLNPSPTPNFPRVPSNGGNRGGASGTFFYRETGYTQGGSYAALANTGGGGGGGTYFNNVSAVWGGQPGAAGVIRVRI